MSGHGRPTGRAVPILLVLVAIAGLSATAFAADPALVERGRYLAIAGDCIACHTKGGGRPFAGGESLQTPFGPILATNITPSKTHGIGNYTLAQFTDALRRGSRADGGHLYPAMPYTAYALVSDDDVNALYAYFMNGVEPVDAPSPQTKLPFPFNMRLLLAAWNLLFLKDNRFQPDPRQSEAWNRGAYLVRGLTHCGTCHTPRNLLMGEETSRALAGADLGTWHAPNVTADPNSGIGGWSERELVDYLALGRAGAKSQAAGPMAEAIDYSLRHLNRTDLTGIATYLKTVPAVHDSADTRPPFAWGQASSDVDAVRGIPPPADRDAMSGPLLYDGYCATCHGDRGQGTSDGSSPSLFHNAGVGRANTDNLIMAILEGVSRNGDRPEVLMPGFAAELSDRQIATLGTYLVARFGNPAASVTAEQVHRLRHGTSSTALLTASRVGIIAVPIVVVLAVLRFVFGKRRRREARA